jgi:hypothetical protein
MKSCEKCGTHKEVTKHHILPRFFFKGKGGISYLCRHHHNEVEHRILETERQMSGSYKRYQLEESEYREILKNYLEETVPFKKPTFGNLIKYRKYRK